jgi:Plant transposon protein
MILQTFSLPIGEERKKFAVRQEAAQKDIEHVFGVFQRKFQIMKKLIEQWYVEDICDMMYTCLILHKLDGNRSCQSEQGRTQRSV